MNVLIVEKDSDAQTKYVDRIQALSPAELNTFNLRVNLALESNYLERIELTDILVIGAGFESSEALKLAKAATARNENAHIVLFLSEEAYARGEFHGFYRAGVHKVLPDDCSSIELLEDLVAIYEDLRRKGLIISGKLICVVQAKGGTGATSVTAALGDAYAAAGQKTLLWDLDVETEDLSRAVAMSSASAEMFHDWITGKHEVSRENLSRSLCSVRDNLFLLSPPGGDMSDLLGFVCHTDSMSLCGRIRDLVCSQHNVVIVDTAGRLGPAAGTLVGAADSIIVVIDDSVIGLTGLNLFLRNMKPLLMATDDLYFLFNGVSEDNLAVQEIRERLEAIHHLGDKPWTLPPIPVDPAVVSWAGTGETLYSHESSGLRSVFDQIVKKLA